MNSHLVSIIEWTSISENLKKDIWKLLKKFVWTSPYELDILSIWFMTKYSAETIRSRITASPIPPSVQQTGY
ncbi:MAG: hypothetical protein WAN11_21510 [Syntrophobacteraceae bacterium]